MNVSILLNLLCDTRRFKNYVFQLKNSIYWGWKRLYDFSCFFVFYIRVQIRHCFTIIVQMIMMICPSHHLLFLILPSALLNWPLSSHKSIMVLKYDSLWLIN